MRLIPRLGLRPTQWPNRRRPATTRLRLNALEDRSLPSFGFGWAFSTGGFTSGITVDAAGSVYITGHFNGTNDFDPNNTNPNATQVLTAANGSDGFVAKYLGDGTFQWATDLGSYWADQVAVQGSGVYVAHRNIGLSNAGEYVSRLDSSTGAIAWTTTICPTGYSNGVAVSPTGILYASGSTGNAASSATPNSQTIVDRLDPATGNILWTQTSTGGSASAGFFSIAADGAGNVFVGGGFKGTTTFGGTSLTSYAGAAEQYVWKLTSSGGSVWAGAMGASGGMTPNGITADASGNVYVTGYWNGGTNNWNPGSGKAVSLAFNGGYDVYIVKLVPGKNGAMQLGWAKDIGGPGYDTVGGVAVDGSGNVYTTGEFTGSVNFNPSSGTPHYLSSPTAYSIFVSKLDANGNYVAAASMAPAPTNVDIEPADIALDSAGDVYTTGRFIITTADFDPTGGTYDLTGAGMFVSMLTQTSPQLAISRGPNVGVVPLTQVQLNAAEAAAIRAWAAAGLSAIDIAKMKSVTADVTTLGGDNLGAAMLNGSQIAVDATADGWGWSVNVNASPTAGRMDLLTVVEHELGHTIGLDSRFSGSPNDLMYAYLAPGQRRSPGAADVPNVNTAAILLGEAPRMSDEAAIDWLTAVTMLRPKGVLFTAWLGEVMS